jgi:hypothetical protein
MKDCDLSEKQHIVKSDMHDMTIRQRVNHWIHHNLYFFIFGLLCIIWFLFRTGTKPSRVEYPCQQASVAGANLWFAAYLLPLISIVKSNKNGRGPTARFLGFGIIAVILIAGTIFLFGGPSSDAIAGNPSQSLTGRAITEKMNLTPVTSEIFVVNGTSGNDGGVYQLIRLMESKGTPFYAKGNGKDQTGLIANGDVVIIKVNGQWNERGGTNTDLVRSLIQAIIDHPDGFNGEIIIADNGQAQYGATGTGGNLNYTKNNAEDRSQSMALVAKSFSGSNRVSAYLWDTITTKRVYEYAEDDTNDGYVINETPHPRTGLLVSYPKFMTHYGTYVSFKNGIWNPDTRVYEADRLKIINVPVLKTHGTYGVTGAVKSYMGIPSDKLTAQMGSRAHDTVDEGGMGTEMAETRFPVITILDAIWINANLRPSGPVTTYSQATRINTIAASTDPVALDYWAAQNILMPAAKEKGYSDLSSMDPENNSPGKFGSWLRLSMTELRDAGYRTTIDRNAMNVYFSQTGA